MGGLAVFKGIDQFRILNSVAIFFFGLIVCSNSNASVSQKLIVGFISSETRQDNSSEDYWGLQQRHGFEMALANNKLIEMKFKNNSESAPVALNKAKELVNEGADLIAGLSFSDQAMAVKQ